MLQHLLYEHVPTAFGLKNFPVSGGQSILDFQGNKIDDVLIYGWWVVESYHYFYETPIVMVTIYSDKWIKSVILATDSNYESLKNQPFRILGSSEIKAVKIKKKTDEVLSALGHLSDLNQMSYPKSSYPDHGSGVIIQAPFNVSWQTPRFDSNLRCKFAHRNKSLSRLSMAFLNTLHKVAEKYGYEDFAKAFDIKHRFEYK